MTSGPPAAYRAILRAYPRAFRRQFGPEMAQLYVDRRRHAGAGGVQLLARETFDCLLTAPRLHLENPMTRNTVPIILLVATVAGVALGGPIGLIPALALAVVLIGLRHDRPIAGMATTPWWRWFVGAAVGFAVMFTVLAIDGDELTSIGWTIAFLSGNGAIVLTVIGIGHATFHLVQRMRGAPAA